MYLIIGGISILGILAGLYDLFNKRKVFGITQLFLAIICPIITFMYCSLKERRAFGGTDWEFLVHSATIDGDVLPWIVFASFIAEIILILRTLLIIFKNRSWRG